MSEPTAAGKHQVDTAPGWGAAWDLSALILPLLAMVPLVWLQLDAIVGQQSRWAAVFVPLFLLIAIPRVFRLRTNSEPIEEERGGFIRGIQLAITGTAQAKPLLDRPAGPPHTRRARAAIGTVCFALLIFILAVLWGTPWLACVAAIMVLGGWALGRMTRVHWPAIAAWCGLLFIALPLPGSLESGLIRWIQSLAAMLACGVLDLLRIPNLRYGNLIELKDYLLDIDLACRGLLSFQALAIVAAITMYLRGNGWSTTLLKLLTLPVWGIFLYTVRLLILLLAQHWYGRDLTGGSVYLLVAIASFVWAYLCYLLWDLLLSTILGPVPPEVPELAKYYKRLNRFLCWPNEVPIEDISSSFEYERSRRPHTAAAKAPRLEQPVPNWWQAPALAVPLVAILIAAGFAGVTAGAVSLRNSRTLSAAVIDLSEVQRANLPGKETLPESYESWLRTGFQREEVKPSDRLGRETLVWNFLSGSRQAAFKADLPTRGDGDLVYWYAQRGWDVEEQVLVQGKLNPNWPWIEMTLGNSYGIKARVCHSAMTADGKPFLGMPAALPLNPDQPVSSPQLSLITQLRELTGEAPPLTLQIQMYSDTLDVTRKLDLAEFRKLYEQLREKLVQDQSNRSWTFGFED